MMRRTPPPLDEAAESLVAGDETSRLSGCKRGEVGSSGALPWLALSALGLANAAEAVEVLCTSYLLTGIRSAESRAAVSSGVYCGMLVGGVFGGLLADGRPGGAAAPRTRVLVLAMALACEEAGVVE